MRRAVFLPLALATLAACSDSIAGPEAGAAPGPARLSTSAAAAGVFVSDARTIAWNEGGVLYAQNLPFPDVGGGRVVWQDVSSGAAAVLAYDLTTGARTQYGTVSGIFAWPATAGRFTIWSEGLTLYLRDGATGSVRAIGSGAGYSAQVSPQGRVAYLDFTAGVPNVAVYDAATGATRIVTRYTSTSGEAAREVDVDGDIVAWSSYTTHSPYTTAIRAASLATGEQRQVVAVNSQAIGGPSVSGSRIVWSDDRSGNYDVYLYDFGTGAQRRITTDPAGQFNARISGGLIVWEDTRNSTSHYFPENDLYLYDLASGTETPVATGPNHQGWPRIDGNRIVWTERADERWEVRTATVQALTLAALSATVDRMLAAGDITNAGAARSLQAFLAQAARAHDTGDAADERAALQRFRQHVQQLAGKQLTATAAARLTAMAEALLRPLGG
jgi:beta propeller repeat protein